MILLKLVFACYPALVVSHGYMAIPKARTGDDEGAALRSPKLAPWLGYKEVIDSDQRGCLGPEGNTNAQIGPRGQTTISPTPIMIINQPFTVTWDIRLGHSLSKNHVRIAYRSYTANVTISKTQFAQGILFEEEDDDGDRAAERSPTYDMYLTTGLHTQTVTLPSGSTPGPAELQWVWASERDGSGGYYISCADVIIMASNDTTATLPPSAIPPTPVASQADPNSFQCYVGTDTNRQEQLCTAPVNTRCMTTMSTSIYYSCSSFDYCDSAMEEDLISIHCCDTNLCNNKSIVDLSSEWDASWKPIAIMGFITGFAHLLL